MYRPCWRRDTYDASEATEKLLRMRQTFSVRAGVAAVGLTLQLYGESVVVRRNALTRGFNLANTALLWLDKR